MYFSLHRHVLREFVAAAPVGVLAGGQWSAASTVRPQLVELYG
ncbi:hypothetical protein [Streptomyces sp. NPDC058545]